MALIQRFSTDDCTFALEYCAAWNWSNISHGIFQSFASIDASSRFERGDSFFQAPGSHSPSIRPKTVASFSNVILVFWSERCCIIFSMYLRCYLILYDYCWASRFQSRIRRISTCGLLSSVLVIFRSHDSLVSMGLSLVRNGVFVDVFSRAHAPISRIGQ